MARRLHGHQEGQLRAVWGQQSAGTMEGHHHEGRQRHGGLRAGVCHTTLHLTVHHSPVLQEGAIWALLPQHPPQGRSGAAGSHWQIGPGQGQHTQHQRRQPGAAVPVQPCPIGAITFAEALHPFEALLQGSEAALSVPWGQLPPPFALIQEAQSSSSGCH